MRIERRTLLRGKERVSIRGGKKMRRTTLALAVVSLLLLVACSTSPPAARPSEAGTGSSSPSQVAGVPIRASASSSPQPAPTEGEAVPSGRGFAAERVFSKHDDWEPAIAADDAGHVYMITTRYGAEPACKDCPPVFIALKRSTDGGATWLPDQYLCKCKGHGWQADPVLMVDDTGRVFATWLQNFKPGVALDAFRQPQLELPRNRRKGHIGSP
jgi:hypothetical protein